MSDKELITGILSNDQKYFKNFVDKYQLMVLNTCNSFLHNKNDAEDITQEVFIEVFLSIHKFKETARLSTWLYRISANKSLNFMRDNKKRKIIKSIGNFFYGTENSELQIPDNSNDDAENKYKQNEKIKLLHKSINTLSKNQKIAFTLSKFENLSYVQISKIMNLSLSSVEGLMHRAKNNVRKKILNFYKRK